MKKICVIGNSHAGTFYTAYSRYRAQQTDSRFKDFVLDFYANPGPGLNEIKIKESVLTGYSHSSDNTNNVDLKKYDLFLIYCDLFAPNVVSQIQTQIKINFSQQVIEETIKDRIKHTNSIRLFREITKTIPATIYMASTPAWVGEFKICKNEYTDNIEFIRQAIQPAIYIESALKFLNEDFSANKSFYQDDGRHLDPNSGGREQLLHFLSIIEKHYLSHNSQS